jgi:hypothetical protein
MDRADTLADGLHRQITGSAEDRDTYYWAWEEVQQLIDSGSTRQALSVIGKALLRSRNASDIRRIGSSVLESLLASDVRTVLDLIEGEHVREPSLRMALRSVSVDGFPADVRERIKRLI